MIGIRCFVGVMTPESIRPAVVGLQKTIGSLPASFKMVETENLHMCLSFLGNVGNNEAERTIKRLEEICSAHDKFEVDVEKIKLIPSKNYVRVIVLDVSSKSGVLEEISSEIKEKIGGSVKPPHITLCRVRSVSDKGKFMVGVDNFVKANADMELKFSVDSISLIKSQLTPSGPVYNIVKNFGLG